MIRILLWLFLENQMHALTIFLIGFFGGLLIFFDVLGGHLDPENMKEIESRKKYRYSYLLEPMIEDKI